MDAPFPGADLRDAINHIPAGQHESVGDHRHRGDPLRDIPPPFGLAARPTGRAGRVAAGTGSTFPDPMGDARSAAAGSAVVAAVRAMIPDPPSAGISRGDVSRRRGWNARHGPPGSPRSPRW